MGVLNVTPDSFSDGGRFYAGERLDVDAAIEAGRQMVADGADVIDIGGESTRPGASPVAPDEEAARVLPVIAGLAGTARLSVDTRHADVARAAVAAGVTLINDVSASLASVAAECGVGWVAMHMRGEPSTMQKDIHYDNVVAEVVSFLSKRAAAATDLGIGEVWIDPGIGFGKTFSHNLTLLAHLRRIVDLGLPVLVGTSRKGFLAQFSDGAPPAERLEASLATAVWAMNEGARMVRVHDVAATVDAARLIGEPVEEVAVR
jgi:dihydropteroate synthase